MYDDAQGTVPWPSMSCTACLLSTIPSRCMGASQQPHSCSPAVVFPSPCGRLGCGQLGKAAHLLDASALAALAQPACSLTSTPSAPRRLITPCRPDGAHREDHGRCGRAYAGGRAGGHQTQVPLRVGPTSAAFHPATVDIDLRVPRQTWGQKSWLAAAIDRPDAPLASPVGPLPLCSENPDYHLLTDANLSYSMRYAPMPPTGQQQQPQYGGPLHPGHMGSPGGALGGPAPHMLHMGPMSPGPRANGGAAAGGATITIAVPEDKVGVVIGKQVGGQGRAHGMGEAAEGIAVGCGMQMQGRAQAWCSGLRVVQPRHQAVLRMAGANIFGLHLPDVCSHVMCCTASSPWWTASCPSPARHRPMRLCRAL